jgi:GTP-binding protein, HSR1-related
MSIQAEILFQTYDKTAHFVQTNQFETTEFQTVQTMFEDKRKKPDAHIMVYGVYNAGKSTLINALLGKVVAEIDDVPKTDSVSAYRWRQYDILDTPGVDAPIEHEQITDEEMLKADAVIFVVNPVGVAEELGTLSKLLELVKARKQVFLVFNEKQPLAIEDFQKLKDQTQSRLQELAAKSGLSNVLKDIPIVRVNAKSALKAKTENKSALLESSGFPEFEKRLTEFLQSISQDTIYVRLKNALVDFLSGSLNILKMRSQADMVKKYDDLLKNIERNKNQVRRNVRQAIANERNRIGSEVQRQLRRNVFGEENLSESDIEKCIQAAFEYSAEKVNNTLQNEVEALMQQLQVDIDNIQAEIPPSNFEMANINIQNIDNSSPSMENVESIVQEASQISPEMMAQTVERLTKLAKPEYIVESLKFVKKYLPELMKGIGIKTMEKWAKAIMNKLPYIGPMITGLFALKDIFTEDSQTTQMKQKIDEHNRQRERTMQQITDISNDIASRFENIMREHTEKVTDEIFTNIMKQIHALRQGFRNDDRQNSEWIEQLSAYYTVAYNA